VIGAIVGSRLAVFIDRPDRFLESWSSLRVLMMGQSIIGALIGGLVGVELAKRRAGIALSTGDAFVAPLAVGIAIGRIGCFVAGLHDDTYGTSTALPTAAAAEAREMLRRLLSIRIGSLASYAPVRRLRRRTHSPYQSTSPTTVLRASPPSPDASKTRWACLAEVTRCFTRVFLMERTAQRAGQWRFLRPIRAMQSDAAGSGVAKNSSTPDCSGASAHATSWCECCKLPTLAGQLCPAAAHGARGGVSCGAAPVEPSDRFGRRSSRSGGGLQSRGPDAAA
jgi:hypothetical protein